jgi:hypothetical protein
MAPDLPVIRLLHRVLLLRDWGPLPMVLLLFSFSP